MEIDPFLPKLTVALRKALGEPKICTEAFVLICQEVLPVFDHLGEHEEQHYCSFISRMLSLLGKATPGPRNIEGYKKSVYALKFFRLIFLWMVEGYAVFMHRHKVASFVLLWKGIALEKQILNCYCRKCSQSTSKFQWYHVTICESYATELKIYPSSEATECIWIQDPSSIG